jgi:hypothetical protein
LLSSIDDAGFRRACFPDAAEDVMDCSMFLV